MAIWGAATDGQTFFPQLPVQVFVAGNINTTPGGKITRVEAYLQANATVRMAVYVGGGRYTATDINPDRPQRLLDLGEVTAGGVAGWYGVDVLADIAPPTSGLLWVAAKSPTLEWRQNVTNGDDGDLLGNPTYYSLTSAPYDTNIPFPTDMPFFGDSLETKPTFFARVIYTPGPPIPPDNDSGDLMPRLLRHLLPNGRAWWMMADSQLSKLVRGVASLPQAIRKFIDLIWYDLFPQTTREIPSWESQFNLQPAAGATDQSRRDSLAAAWQALGAQSLSYIQTNLQTAGFPVYIHEWWVTPATTPPVARDPRVYLGTPQYTCLAGEATMQAGEALAQAGERITSAGISLVNKNGTGTTYTPSATTTEWPHYIYVGAQTFPEFVPIPNSRREEFERLLLKLCPSQLWIGLLVEYV